MLKALKNCGVALNSRDPWITSLGNNVEVEMQEHRQFAVRPSFIHLSNTNPAISSPAPKIAIQIAAARVNILDIPIETS